MTRLCLTVVNEAEVSRFKCRLLTAFVALLGPALLSNSFAAHAQSAPSVTLEADAAGALCQRRFSVAPASPHGYQGFLRQRLNGQTSDIRFEVGRGASGSQLSSAFQTPSLASTATYEFWMQTCLNATCANKSAWSSVVRFRGPNNPSCVPSRIPTVTLEPSSHSDGCTRRFALSPPSPFGYQVMLVQRLSSGDIIPMRHASDRVTSANNNRTPPLQNSANYQLSARSCSDPDCNVRSDWSNRVDFTGPSDPGCVAKSAPPQITIRREACQIWATTSIAPNAGAQPKALKIELIRDSGPAGATNDTVVESKIALLDQNTANRATTVSSFAINQAGSFTVQAVACVHERCEQSAQNSDAAAQSINVSLAIGECQPQSGNDRDNRELAVVRSMCDPHAAINAPLGDLACTGAFTSRPVDLSYLIPDSSLKKYLGEFALSYSSGDAKEDYHGFGAGWFLSPISLVLRQDSATKEAWLIGGSGFKERLILQPDGTHRPQKDPLSWSYTFGPENEVRALNNTQDIARVYRLAKPGVFALTEVKIMRPGMPWASIILNSTIRGNGQAGAGSIVFSEGNHAVRWVYDQRINALRFSSSAGNQFATLVLGRDGRLTSARLSSDGVVSPTSNRMRDMRFTYNASKLLASFSSSVAGATENVYAFYDAFNMVRAINQANFTTTYSRIRYADGSTVLSVSQPNRVTSQYRYSIDKLLIEQRSFVDHDMSNFSRHFNVAKFLYEAPPVLGGAHRLAEVGTQKSGDLVRFRYVYDEANPTAVRLVDQQSASGVTARRTVYTWNQSGLLDGIKEELFKPDGSAREVVSGYSVGSRESVAPFRPESIQNLVSRESADFSYSRAETTVRMKDRNGTQTETMQLDSGLTSQRLVGLQDNLGIKASLNWQYNEAGKVTAQRSSYGESVENHYNGQGQLTQVTEIDELGVRTVTSLDPASGRVTATSRVYPTGVSENTKLEYQLWPGGAVRSVTKSIEYVTGVRGVEIYEFSEAGALVAIVRDGVRSEVG